MWFYNYYVELSLYYISLSWFKNSNFAFNEL
jgi:hypothetical protein